MAYTPNTWATGDTITAQKLNNMEQGIASAGGGLLLVTIVPIPDDEFGNTTLDKTWQEIHDAVLASGIFIVRRETDEGYESISMAILSQVLYDALEETYPYFVVAGDIEYATATANGYPQTHWTN